MENRLDLDLPVAPGLAFPIEMVQKTRYLDNWVYLFIIRHLYGNESPPLKLLRKSIHIGEQRLPLPGGHFQLPPHFLSEDKEISLLIEKQSPTLRIPPLQQF